MAALDFSKMIDFGPIEKVGLSKEDGLKLLASLSPIVDMEFQKKIKDAFTDEEMSEIGKEAESQGIKPEDGLFFLEEKYHAKTGNYFMQEMKNIFDDYVVKTAAVIEQAKRDTATFAQSGDENVKKINELIEAGNFDEAAKLLDQTVGPTPQENTSG